MELIIRKITKNDSKIEGTVYAAGQYIYIRPDIDCDDCSVVVTTEDVNAITTHTATDVTEET